jgi:thioesterase domain-containing protein
VLEREHALFGLRPPLDGWSDDGNGESDGDTRPAEPAHGLGRSDPPSSVQELARPLLREMLRVQPEGPYLIAGYSFGGIVAYELAGRLIGLGHRVAFLGLVDMMTPRLWARDVTPRLRHLVTSRRRRTTAARLVTVRRRQARVALAHVGLREPASPKPDGFAYLERMRLLGGRYRTDGLDCPLVVFLTEASLAVTGSPTLGWETVHHGPIEAVEVPGDHLTLWKEPNVARLAAEVAARVKSAAR